jgi:alpha/beta superfamily hydrolase
MHLTLPGPTGPLEALLEDPSSTRKPDQPASAPRAAVVFAHPHPQLGGGGTMHTKVVFQGAKGLARIGCAVLRFNFRGVGQSAGAFDEGKGERDDFQAALDYMHNRYPGTPLWAAGFSFGAWIALETGAEDARVSALIGVAPAVVGRGYDFSATLESMKPKFLVHGGLDEIVPVKEVWAFYARLKEPKELVVIDGASHLFEGKTVDVGEALEDLLGDFD